MQRCLRLSCEVKYNTMTKSNLIRMDNIGIVVESLDETIAFFAEPGLQFEGRAIIAGEWAGRVTALGNQHVEIAMMVTLMATADSKYQDF